MTVYARCIGPSTLEPACDFETQADTLEALKPLTKAHDKSHPKASTMTCHDADHCPMHREYSTYLKRKDGTP